MAIATGITQVDQLNIGGSKILYVANTADIDEITLDADGIVDSITMVATKKFYPIEISSGQVVDTKQSGRTAGAYTQKITGTIEQITNAARKFITQAGPMLRVTVVAMDGNGAQRMLGFKGLTGAGVLIPDGGFLDTSNQDTGATKTDMAKQELVFSCIADEPMRFVEVDMTTLI